MKLPAEFFSAFALSIGIAIMVQGCATGSYGEETQAAQPAAGVSFAAQIAPMFEARCTQCHGGEEPQEGLDLSTYEGALAGSSYGPVIEAGSVNGSLMIDWIASGDMPKEGDPVTPEELDLLRAWIAAGALDN